MTPVVEEAVGARARAAVWAAQRSPLTRGGCLVQSLYLVAAQALFKRRIELSLSFSWGYGVFLNAVGGTAFRKLILVHCLSCFFSICQMKTLSNLKAILYCSCIEWHLLE